MATVKVEKNSYTVEPLYQWDLNQELEIYGLSLASIPEIHFANAAMGRAIVRQATMDAAGVVRVEVPNSLLQKPYTIQVYVCTYAGSTFETQYKLELPVKARTQPSDYELVDDPEVYSFNALENEIQNVLRYYGEIGARYEAAVAAQKAAETAYKNAKDEVDEAVAEATQSAVQALEEEIFSDTTKELYGLPEDATPDDAFQAILDMDSFKVGDTLNTFRTDLDDKWLLCNGDEVSVHDYAELGELFPRFDKAWTTENFGSVGAIYSVTYANGYWVVCGTSDQKARIAYATDLSGPWTTKDLWTNGDRDEVRSIVYANGYWVAGGSYYWFITEDDGNVYSNRARIAYATDLSGPWTTKDLWEHEVNQQTTLYGITYVNGYFVACGYSYTSSGNAAILAYSTAPNTDWTTKTLWTSRYGVTGPTVAGCYGITYADGYWTAVGQYRENATTGTIVRVAYATDISGEWTLNDSLSDKITGVPTIAYANGYLVVGGQRQVDSGYCARIAYTTNPTGNWTIKDLWNGSSSPNKISSMCYDTTNGYWVLGGVYYVGNNNNTNAARIAFAKNITGEWETVDAWNNASNSTDLEIRGLVCADDRWVAGGPAKIAHINTDTFYLPIVSPEAGYTYIKAKE